MASMTTATAKASIDTPNDDAVFIPAFLPLEDDDELPDELPVMPDMDDIPDIGPDDDDDDDITAAGTKTARPVE